MKNLAAVFVCFTLLLDVSNAFVQSPMNHLWAAKRPLIRSLVEMNMSPRQEEVESRRSFFEKAGASAAAIVAGCISTPDMSNADTCTRKDCQPKVSLVIVQSDSNKCEVGSRRQTFFRRAAPRRRQISRQCQHWRERCSIS
jgi:hypothetical protein